MFPVGFAVMNTNHRHALRFVLAARSSGPNLPVGSMTWEELKLQARHWALVSMEQALVHCDEATLEV